jgi:uncharacterized protein (TIGR03083 family)
MMNDVDYFAVITDQARALADAARRSDPEARVPSCPDWNVAKLVKHTGTAHRWSAGVVRTREPLAPKQIDLELPGDPSGFPDWLERGTGALVEALRGADPDAECWTWTDARTVGFWSRRMAHETAVHRWDAQGAGGAPEPFDGALAADGIDEHLRNLPSIIGADAIAGDGQTLHLHCTDRDGEWFLRRTADGLEVTREHAKGDVAIRGAASDLLLLVVGRTPAAAPEVFGAPADHEAWLALLHF